MSFYRQAVKLLVGPKIVWDHIRVIYYACALCIGCHCLYHHIVWITALIHVRTFIFQL